MINIFVILAYRMPCPIMFLISLLFFMAMSKVIYKIQYSGSAMAEIDITSSGFWP